MKALKWLVPCTTAALITACGGGQKPAEDPTGETTDAVTEGETEGEAGGGEKEFHDMNREERMEFMGLVVMPEMQKLFSEYDAEGYKEFKCQTCHGNDMKEVDYKMPNGLYGLPAEGTIEASKEYDAEVTDFMMNKVLPKMAELLHEEPGKEFTCLSCHEKEE